METPEFTAGQRQNPRTRNDYDVLCSDKHSDQDPQSYHPDSAGQIPRSESPAKIAQLENEPESQPHKLFIGKTRGEKKDIISSILHSSKMTWADLIELWIRETPGQMTGKRHQEKAKQLLDLIWGKEDMLTLFSRTESFAERVTGSAARVIQAEVDVLRENTRFFGKYDSTANIDQIDFSEAVDEVKSNAPNLTQLITIVSERRWGYRPKKEPSSSYVALITSILSTRRAKQTGNFLARSLGLYMYTSGVPRRVISILQELGAIDAYRTIFRTKNLLRLKDKDNLYIAYDNFEYMERVRHQVIGDAGSLRRMTTGKAFLGREIPAGGLRQVMLRDGVELTLKDILTAPGNDYDQCETQISSYFIVEAIRTTFPEETSRLFTKIRKWNSVNPHKYNIPEMPKIDILPLEKTQRVVLGPISAEEGSISGNISVLENIFLHQLRFNQETDFSERLFLIFGDQLTVQRIRSIISLRNETNQDFNCYRWALPVLALFHLKMNLIWLIFKHHFGDQEGNTNQYSTIHAHAEVLNRKVIPPGQSPFNYTEELTMHSFYGRIIGLLLVKLKSRLRAASMTEIKSSIAELVGNLSPQGFLTLVEEIRQMAFSKEVRNRANENNTELTDVSVPEDEEFTNHVRFFQEMETYCTLKYAIKHGDLGLIQRIIPRCCLYFQGAKLFNYAREMLEMQRLLSTKACSPELQRAILINSLINVRGKENSFKEVDLDIEHHNGNLKEFLNSRRNGTVGVDTLCKYAILCSDYATNLKEAIESSWGEGTYGNHTKKDPGRDIFSLAWNLHESSLVWTGGRTCLHRSPNIMGDGIDAFLTGALGRFNAQFAYRRGRSRLENQNEDTRFDINRGEEDAKGVPLLDLEPVQEAILDSDTSTDEES